MKGRSVRRRRWKLIGKSIRRLRSNPLLPLKIRSKVCFWDSSLGWRRLLTCQPGLQFGSLLKFNPSAVQSMLLFIQSAQLIVSGGIVGLQLRCCFQFVLGLVEPAVLPVGDAQRHVTEGILRRQCYSFLEHCQGFLVL